MDKIKTFGRELLESVLPALVIVLVVNVFLAQATRVEGQSMVPNLHNNERLIIEKVTYRFHEPQAGDIVVLKRPNRVGEPLIKRIVGVPGQTIEIQEGLVFVDGKPYEEPYLDQATWGKMEPVIVPEEHLFVLGDNRGASNDSRAFGVISYDDVVGRAWFRYWPLSEMGSVGKG